MKKISVIGSGIAGLAAATDLAAKGFDVTIFEKNNKSGGRINSFEVAGYRFDMGPSWYWMPEVFEDFYGKYNHTASDFYDLVRLDPSYRVVFSEDEHIDIPADFGSLVEIFEELEPGSGDRLHKFMNEAEFKYKVGMSDFVWKPAHSILEFANPTIIKNAFKLQLFNSIAKEIRTVVSHPRLRKILEFPVLFLGATPQNTPALYSLMNYADLKLGTWYPMGGMHKIAEAFTKIALEQGVSFNFNTPITSFSYSNDRITHVISKDLKFETDMTVAAADYHHVDQNILSSKYANYTSTYWDKRKLAPSSILMFLGINKKIKNLKHHNLFFDTDFERHAAEIYTEPIWPSDPLFYVCAPSVTDPSVAPVGKENLFVLIPIAPDLDDRDTSIYNRYYNVIIERIEKYTGVDIKDHIDFKKFFGVSDFKTTYNSFKGNAYGLANTLFQTAFLKPALKNKKLSNLYYAGQMTTPGPGLPPSIISGQVAATEIAKLINLEKYA